MSGTRVVTTSTCPPAGQEASDGMVVVVELVVVVVVDVVVVGAALLLVVDVLAVVVVVLGAVEVVDVLVVEVVVGIVLLVVEDVELVVVVLGAVSRPASAILPVTTCPATNRPVSVAPSVTCRVPSNAQTRAPTSALREMAKRDPCVRISRSSAGPRLDLGPIRTSPATKTCAAESASSTAPRRVRRLQNT
jgi:hypothetical protein